jgi:sulfoxide reductase heme-binding subunit YedZ
MKPLAIAQGSAIAAALAPLLFLLQGYQRGTLGPHPLETLTRGTGWWALTLLLASLAMAPLRRLAGFPWSAPFARLFGLLAFLYACLHLLTYLWVDKAWNFAAMLDDVLVRAFILLGFSAWLLLLPLALTSTRGWQRRLKGNWKRLHRLVYLAAPLAALHFLLRFKTLAVARQGLLFAAAVAALLLLRLPLPARKPAP